MVKLTINDKNVEIHEGATILEAASAAGIEIPTLCYLKEINEIGACRLCLVEVEGCDHLCTACNTVVADGMVVCTNNQRIRNARRVNAQLIISQHDYSCTNCFKNGSCSLQSIAKDLGITEEKYDRKLFTKKWDSSLPYIKNNERCIKCMRCITVCEKVQGMNVWDVSGTGERTYVGISAGTFEKSNCTVCGQCVLHCPVGALYERNDTANVFRAIADEDTKTAVLVAPAVKSSWGEPFGLTREEATEGKLCDALSKIGFDYIFNTAFSSDQNSIAEATILADNIKSGNKKMQISASCPSLVKFIKSEFPEYEGNLSSVLSSQLIMGAAIKSNIKDKLYTVSAMPCIAKKTEFNATSGINASITVRELVKMIKEASVNVKTLSERSYDEPFAKGSGASALFGISGGYADAALRTAYYYVTGKNPNPDAFAEIRGNKGICTAEFDFDGKTVSVAVVSGLANARKLLNEVKKGSASYDYVEIMACPGGCAGGGGQPINEDAIDERTEYMCSLDKNSDYSFAHENEDAVKLMKTGIASAFLHSIHKN